MDLHRFQLIERMKSIILLLFVVVSESLLAQPTEKEKSIIKLIDDTNQKIDNAVVGKDVAALQKFYGDDYVFDHASGQVDTKTSWIKTIQNPAMRYLSREHDSTQVELHGDVAIVRGRLSITREDKAGVSKYGVWYVRVYALRKKTWQLISHRSTQEWHETPVENH